MLRFTSVLFGVVLLLALAPAYAYGPDFQRPLADQGHAASQAPLGDMYYSGIGRSEALRRSMLAMMADGRKPYFAHPIFWAPSVVVGEGGANGQQTQ